MKSYGIRNGVRPTITTAEEGTIALVAGDKGAIFYNTDTDSLRTWDGSAFQNGGGGGAGERDFVATGTIGAGAVVALKSDGTVEVVTNTVVADTLEPRVAYESLAVSGDVSSVFDPIANRVVVTYKRTADSYHYSTLGTISGDTISFSTPVVVLSEIILFSDLVYDSFSGNIVLVYRNSSSKGATLVGTVGASSISWGTAQIFETGTNNGRNVVAVNGDGEILILYAILYPNGYNYAIAGTISGTTISFGTRVTVSATDTGSNDVVYDTGQSAFVVFWRDNTNIDGSAKVITLSGTTITIGALYSFSAGPVADICVAYHTIEGKIVLAYSYNTDSFIMAVTVSSLSLVFGTAQTYSSVTQSTQGDMVYDSINNRIIQAAEYNAVGEVYSFSLSGTTFTEETNLQISGRPTYISATFDSVGDHTVFSYYDFTDSYIGYSSVRNPARLESNVPDTIGINTTSKVNAETATVTILAGTSGGHSALVIGDICYVNYQGTITQTLPTDVYGFKRLGIAVSATEILLDLEEEQEQITITQSQISDLSINIADLGDELSGSATLPTGNNAIDFKANIQYDKTLDAAWAPTFTNPIKGKSIVIIATGANAAYTLTVPATVKGDISGFDGTMTNQLTLYCLDATTPVYSIDIKTW